MGRYWIYTLFSTCLSQIRFYDDPLCATDSSKRPFLITPNTPYTVSMILPPMYYYGIKQLWRKFYVQERSTGSVKELHIPNYTKLIKGEKKNKKTYSLFTYFHLSLAVNDNNWQSFLTWRQRNENVFNCIIFIFIGRSCSKGQRGVVGFWTTEQRKTCGFRFARETLRNLERILVRVG